MRKEMRDAICAIGGTIIWTFGVFSLFGSIPLGCVIILVGIDVFYYGIKNQLKQATGSVDAPKKHKRKLNIIGIAAWGISIFGFISIFIFFNALLSTALIIGGTCLIVLSWEGTESQTSRKKPKKNPLPVTLTPRNSVPTLEEKFIVFWRKVDWLRIIPRLKRANILLLAKVLDLNTEIVKQYLPQQMKTSGFQVEGNYIRLPESIKEFINALQKAFTQWNANSKSTGEIIASNEKVGTWVLVLEQVLLSAGGEVNLQRSWISKLIEVNEEELETLVSKMLGENWFHINGDLIVLHPCQGTSDILKLEDVTSRNELSVEQANFMDEIDKNLAGSTSDLENTKKIKEEH